MQARYRLSEQDYVNAGVLFARPTPGLWLLAAAGLAVLLALMLWGQPPLRHAAAGGLAVGLLLAALIRWGLNPWLLRRHYRQYKAIQQEQVLTLLDSGLHLANPDGHAHVGWHQILKWRCNAHYVLVYPMPRLYYVVPTAVAQQGFDLPALTAALARHVGPAA